MKEISCNIIRDLLPSYMDDICSEDSRLLVDEHLTRCEQCRTQLEMLKNTELTDEQGEQKRISCLKKLKRHYANKGIVSLIFLTLIIIGGFWFMVHHHELVDSNLLYISFPLLLIAAYCLMPDSLLSAKHPKISGIFIFVSILMSIIMIVYYATFVFCWNISIDRAETGPFGIPLSETGLYLEKKLVFIAVTQLSIFILSNILIFRGYRINKCIYGLTLTGAWLAAGYIGTLHNMSTVETLYRLLTRMTVCLIIEGIVFSVTAYIFVKKVLN